MKWFIVYFGLTGQLSFAGTSEQNCRSIAGVAPHSSLELMLPTGQIVEGYFIACTYQKVPSGALVHYLEGPSS